MINIDHQAATAFDRTLIELIDLGLLAKQAHWNIVGPMFRELHLVLDELADVARDAADEIAERAITLGHNPDGRASTIARDGQLPTLDAGSIRDTTVVSAFAAILEVVVSNLHSAIDAMATDPVTQDLLTSIAASLEKQAWMIRAHGS